MKRTLKLLARSLLLLILLVLLVLVAWLLSNIGDAEPQPWPQELRVGPNRLPEADNLYHALPAAQANGISLSACGPSGDCAAAWRQRLPAWRAQPEAAAMFAACEALAQRPQLQYEEQLPERVTAATALPEYQRLTACSNHLLLRAFEHVGDGQAALTWLQQADRFGRAVQQGARTLIGQRFAATLAENQLLVLREIGQQRPELGPHLAPLAELAAEEWRGGTLRWIRAEAETVHHQIEDMVKPEGCRAQPDPGLVALGWCRAVQGVTQPNYQQQLFATFWTRLQNLARQHPVETLPQAVQEVTQSEGAWSWFHSVPHVIFDVAKPAWTDYFARTADLLLSSQATALWLRAQAQPATERATWARAQAQGELARRLTISPEGAWSLQTWRSQGIKDLPVHWPATRS